MMKSYTLTNWDGTHVGHNQEASQPPSNPSFTGASTLASNPQITSDNTVEYISIGDTIIRKEQEMESTEDTDLVDDASNQEISQNDSVKHYASADSTLLDGFFTQGQNMNMTETTIQKHNTKNDALQEIGKLNASQIPINTTPDMSSSKPNAQVAKLITNPLSLSSTINFARVPSYASQSPEIKSRLFKPDLNSPLHATLPPNTSKQRHSSVRDFPVSPTSPNWPGASSHNKSPVDNDVISVYTVDAEGEEDDDDIIIIEDTESDVTPDKPPHDVDVHDSLFTPPPSSQGGYSPLEDIFTPSPPPADSRPLPSLKRSNMCYVSPPPLKRPREDYHPMPRQPKLKKRRPDPAPSYSYSDLAKALQASYNTNERLGTLPSNLRVKAKKVDRVPKPPTQSSSSISIPAAKPPKRTQDIADNSRPAKRARSNVIDLTLSDNEEGKKMTAKPLTIRLPPNKRGGKDALRISVGIIKFIPPDVIWYNIRALRSCLGTAASVNAQYPGGLQPPARTMRPRVHALVQRTQQSSLASVPGDDYSLGDILQYEGQDFLAESEDEDDVLLINLVTSRKQAQASSSTGPVSAVSRTESASAIAAPRKIDLAGQKKASKPKPKPKEFGPRRTSAVGARQQDRAGPGAYPPVSGVYSSVNDIQPAPPLMVVPSSTRPAIAGPTYIPGFDSAYTPFNPNIDLGATIPTRQNLHLFTPHHYPPDVPYYVPIPNASTKNIGPLTGRVAAAADGYVPLMHQAQVQVEPQTQGQAAVTYVDDPDDAGVIDASDILVTPTKPSPKALGKRRAVSPESHLIPAPRQSLFSHLPPAHTSTAHPTQNASRGNLDIFFHDYSPAQSSAGAGGTAGASSSSGAGHYRTVDTNTEIMALQLQYSTPGEFGAPRWLGSGGLSASSSSPAPSAPAYHPGGGLAVSNHLNFGERGLLPALSPDVFREDNEQHQSWFMPQDGYAYDTVDPTLLGGMGELDDPVHRAEVEMEMEVLEGATSAPGLFGTSVASSPKSPSFRDTLSSGRQRSLSGAAASIASFPNRSLSPALSSFGAGGSQVQQKRKAVTQKKSVAVEKTSEYCSSLSTSASDDDELSADGVDANRRTGGSVAASVVSSSSREGMVQVGNLFVSAAVARSVNEDNPWPKEQVVNNSYCHQCRRKTNYMLMWCVCRKAFCCRCLLTRYPESTFSLVENESSCPYCDKTCNCTQCSSKRGEEYVSCRPKPKRKKAEEFTTMRPASRRVVNLPSRLRNGDFLPSQSRPSTPPSPPSPFVVPELASTSFVRPPPAAQKYWGTIYSIGNGTKICTAFAPIVSDPDALPPVVFTNLPQTHTHPSRVPPRTFVGKVQRIWGFSRKRILVNLPPVPPPTSNIKTSKKASVHSGFTLPRRLRYVVGNPAMLRYRPILSIGDGGASGVRDMLTSLSPLTLIDDSDSGSDSDCGDKANVDAEAEADVHPPPTAAAAEEVFVPGSLEERDVANAIAASLNSLGISTIFKDVPTPC